MKAGNVGMKEAPAEEEPAVAVVGTGALNIPNGSNPELVDVVPPVPERNRVKKGCSKSCDHSLDEVKGSEKELNGSLADDEINPVAVSVSDLSRSSA